MKKFTRYRGGGGLNFHWVKGIKFSGSGFTRSVTEGSLKVSHSARISASGVTNSF